jgi:hypothetical protein
LPDESSFNGGLPGSFIEYLYLPSGRPASWFHDAEETDSQFLAGAAT